MCIVQRMSARYQTWRIERETPQYSDDLRVWLNLEKIAEDCVKDESEVGVGREKDFPCCPLTFQSQPPSTPWRNSGLLDIYSIRFQQGQCLSIFSASGSCFCGEISYNAIFLQAQSKHPRPWGYPDCLQYSTWQTSSANESSDVPSGSLLCLRISTIGSAWISSGGSKENSYIYTA